MKVSRSPGFRKLYNSFFFQFCLFFSHFQSRPLPDHFQRNVFFSVLFNIKKSDNVMIINNNNNKIEFQFRQQLVDGVLTTLNMQYTSSWPLQRGSFHIFFALDGAFPFMTGYALVNMEVLQLLIKRSH